MAVLVTGGTGFIGSFLVDELVRRGHDVRCLVLEGEPLKRLEGLPLKVYYGDVRRIETLYDAVEGVDTIYHLAGVKTAWDVAEYFRINYRGTKNLLEAAMKRRCRLGRFVFVSSQLAAGPSLDGRPLTEEDDCRPLGSYGKSKRRAEEYLQSQAHRVPITILRPSLVYGPRDPELDMLFRVMKWGLMPAIGPGEQCFSLIYVRDVVEGLILAAEHERSDGQIYFMTAEESCTPRQIAERVFRMQQRRGRTISIPWGGMKLIAGLIKSYKRLRGQPHGLIDEKLEELRHAYWVCSGQKARRELGFEPRYSLDQGIREIIQWVEGAGNHVSGKR